MFDISFCREPELTFGHGQRVEDPRDGLTLFGPLDEGKPLGLRIAAIGTERGVGFLKAWLRRVQGPLTDAGSQVARPFFPGFREAFRIPLASEIVLDLRVTDVEIEASCNLDDRHQRVYTTVGVFADRILDSLVRDEVEADVWFIIIPDLVHKNCRPRSQIPVADQVRAEHRLNPRWGRRLRREPSLFQEDNIAAVAYSHDVDFHNQLKARLLSARVPTQIIRESTIAPPGVVVAPKRDMAGFQAAIAWNLATTSFYKAGFRPWKIGEIRSGVCYVGLVFKKDERESDPRAACCAAQMFLDSGDGLVFRGAVGPWYSPDAREYHLSRSKAKELVELAVQSYKNQHSGEPPSELFIHGKVRFGNEEWLGFQDAVDVAKTRLVGVKIRGDTGLRLFRTGKHPVLRGTAVMRHERAGYLWTKGYTPRLQTYPGREVPRPLTVDICRGEADFITVANDVMALTKLNYNTCLLADGMPVTLRFADAVGEILTAAPDVEKRPLPFKHYI